jgi:hypothetical protein
MNAKCRLAVWFVIAGLTVGVALAQQPGGPPMIVPKKPIVRPVAASATLVVHCDLACNWKLDGEDKGRIEAGESAKAKVKHGQHILAAVTTDAKDRVQQTCDIKGSGQIIVDFVLQPVRDVRLVAEQAAREQQERERQAREQAAREQQQRERQAEEARKREADQRTIQSAQEFSDKYEAWLKARRTQMGSEVVTVRLKNECATDSIRVVIRFQVPDDSGHWVTSGWWILKPNESLRPTFATAVRDVYFWAEGTSSTYVWNGDGKSDSIAVPVVSNNFVQEDGNNLIGVNQKTVNMFHSVFKAWGEHTQSFSCK